VSNKGFSNVFVIDMGLIEKFLSVLDIIKNSKIRISKPSKFILNNAYSNPTYKIKLIYKNILYSLLFLRALLKYPQIVKAIPAVPY
jgi:hypothetical protein